MQKREDVIELSARLCFSSSSPGRGLPASRGTGSTPSQERACCGQKAMHWGAAEVVVDVYRISEGDAVLVADVDAGAAADVSGGVDEDHRKKKD